MRAFPVTLFLRSTGLALLILSTLAGCQSNPQQTGGAQASSLSMLSDSERQAYQKALAMLTAKDAAGAEDILQGLSENRADVAEIWLNLALAHYQQKELEPAQNALQNLFNYRDATHQGHNLAGLIAVEQGDFDAAQKHYQRALAVQPNYANALYNMALLQDIYLQNVAQAVAYYQKYLQQVPGDEDTKNWLEELRYSLDEQ